MINSNYYCVDAVNNNLTDNQVRSDAKSRFTV